MAKETIQFTFPVEHVSRKMTLRKNTASDQMKLYDEGQSIQLEKPISRYMGAGVRTLFIKGVGNVNKNYYFVRLNKRGTPVRAEEQVVRTNFSAASKLFSAWKKDLATVAKQLQSWNDNETLLGITTYGNTFAGYCRKVAFAVIGGGGTPQSPWPTA